MHLTDRPCLDEYKKRNEERVERLFLSFDPEVSETNFDYLLKTSAVYSSNIEGNLMDVNSYMNSLAIDRKIRPKEAKEIDDLKMAYDLVRAEEFAEATMLEAHKIFGASVLSESRQGVYREEPVGVFDSGGLVYMSVEPEHVKKEMQKFFDDSSQLLACELSVMEAFYFASLIHLRLAHIHPFLDGNGRTARLMEKWFLAQKLGEKMWLLGSEKLYKEHQVEYYKNINLGVNFYEVDYARSLPFLEMLLITLEEREREK